MSVDIGERIRSLRTARGLSQEEVARRTGIGLKSYGDLERGRTRDPHYSTLRGVARALGVRVEELLEEPAVPLGDASETGPPHFTPNLADPGYGLEEISAEILRDTALQLSADLEVNRTYEFARAETREEYVSRVVNFAALKAIGDEFHRRGEEPPEQFILAYRQWLRAMTPPPDTESRRDADHGSSDHGSFEAG